MLNLTGDIGIFSATDSCDIAMSEIRHATYALGILSPTSRARIMCTVG